MRTSKLEARRRRALHLACASLFGGVAAVASAAADVRELPAVTVSVGRGADLSMMDVSTTVITREQVVQAPETTVEQILNKVPGVFALQQPAAQLHPTAQVFSIRGFGTTTNVNTLLMVDGIPVNDAYFRTIDWSQIPKDSIERIEIIRGGGATSLWGNMAMGGIINIVTREPAPDEKRLNVSYGSFNTRTLDAAVTLLATDSLKIGLSYDGIKTDGYNQTPSQYRNPYIVATGSTTNNAVLAMHFSPTQDSKYYLKFLGHKIEETGLIWNDTKNSWDTYRISGGGTTRFAGKSSININGWYGTAEMDTQNAGQTPAFSLLTPALAVPYVSMIEQAKYTTYGGSVFYADELESLKDVKVGVDSRYIDANDHENQYSAVRQTADITARAKHRFKGLFAQGTYRFRAVPLDITLGLREDYWEATSGSLTSTFFGPAPTTASAGLADQSYHRFDPRLGAKYYFNEGLDVRAAAYRNFAAPGMNQMYRSFLSGQSYTATNPTLTPQTNTGKELGVDLVQGGLDVAFTVFYNKLNGFIDYAAQCGDTTSCNPLIAGTGLPANSITRVSQYVNAGDAVFRGAELLANWQASDTLKLNAGYTKTNAYLTSSKYTTPSGGVVPDPIGEQIGQVPKWIATAGALWQPTSALKLSVQLKSFPSYWNNTSHTQLNDAATLVDVGVSYRLAKATEVYGVAQNIGNRKYYDQGLTYTTTNGSTVNNSYLPALGLPMTVTVGLRTSF